MKRAKYLLLAGTVLSLATPPFFVAASATPLRGDVLAQAGSSEQPDHNGQQEKKGSEHHPPTKTESPARNGNPTTPPSGHPAITPQVQHPGTAQQPVEHNERNPSNLPQTPPSGAHQPPATEHRMEQHAPPSNTGQPPTTERHIEEHAQPGTNAHGMPPAPSQTAPNERKGNNAPGGSPPSHAATPNGGVPPTAGTQPTVQPAAPGANPAAVAPPTQTINKSEFLAPQGHAPTANIDQLRQDRHEVREGNRVFIREPDRTIVQEGDRTIIRHNEVDRFAVGAREVHVERHGNETVSIVLRPDGVQIIDTMDGDGRLLRRVQRGRDGREIVIIDNSYTGPNATVFLDVPPPVIRIPRDRYFVEADAANPAQIYGVLIAPPIERIDRRYTLEQIRYNENVRAYMPLLNLDINFDTGSWQLTPDQVGRLAAIADALNRAIQRNPREVFLIEGHTDAVGSDIDNLSLSDRRAEAVAVALTEQFQVPAANLVTQGYGKEGLVVQTNGPERANRRVAIRRITPLVDPQAALSP